MQERMLEACCLLRESLSSILFIEQDALPLRGRIVAWLEHVNPPNPSDNRADAQGESR
jgi:hypothetical protein